MAKIIVDGKEITVLNQDKEDYISLTDMVREEEGDQLIKNWLRNKNTIEYFGAWEKLNNPNFNLVEFDLIRLDAGTNRFTMSAKQWIDRTRAIGITSKTGRYGGTYAHKDLAFEFGMWISPEFKLLLVTEFQRLKDEETRRLNSEWDYRRFLSKANYVVHTDSIKKYVIPQISEEEKKKWAYATEADLLNIALFGFTAAQWRNANPNLAKQGLNVRDLADAHELLVLSNLEGLNAVLNQQKLESHWKLNLLKEAAIQQLQALRASNYTTDKIQSPFKKLATSSTGVIKSGDSELDK